MCKKCKLVSIVMLIVGLMAMCTAASPQQARTEKPYKPTWESLTQHRIPKWYVDAKFGVYAHWGVYSVPAYDGPRYCCRLYQKDHKVYEYHEKHYGGALKFGYKDFVPMFKAEEFDPEEWAELLKNSGAQFAGICLVHHDGFGMWDSEVGRWNVGKMGPCRDIYGELAEAIRKRGMKLIATFHHARTFNFYLPKDVTEEEKQSWDIFDPKYADLYWNEVTSSREDFIAQWKARVMEVINKYRPDLLWFDGMRGTCIPDEVVRTVFAHYYNEALERNKQVDVFNKLPASRQFNFPDEFGILCYENNRDKPDEVPRHWQTDRSIGYPWGYVEGKKYNIPAGVHVDSLVDIVSRDGSFMLSMSPKGSGEIPKEEKYILLEIGKWLKVNGEAIYGTRPWKIFGEGPTNMKVYNKKKERYDWNFDNLTAEDIRFTRKGDVLYAIALDWPEAGQLTIKSLSAKSELCPQGIGSVSMLGSSDKLEWSRNNEGLTIKLPKEKPCDYAFAFKISLIRPSQLPATEKEGEN